MNWSLLVEDFDRQVEEEATNILSWSIEDGILICKATGDTVIVYNTLHARSFTFEKSS